MTKVIAVKSRSDSDVFENSTKKKRRQSRRCCRWSFLKLLLVFLNVTSTALTLFTGLRESPLLTMITGRYGSMRKRLQDGSINFDIAKDDVFRLETLPPLAEIGKDYRFITAPHRDPSTIGEYRSVCTNLNSNTAPVMGLAYDDFWGKGIRRIQIFVYSISAPKCEVLNAKPAWNTKCIADHGGNATLCHQYILDNFDTLKHNRLIQVGTDKDFGERGVPFLRCIGRPTTKFSFQADLVAYQSYWSGSDYHVMVQTSQCRAIPLLQNADLEYALFETQGVDEGADVLLALPPPGWFSWIVSQVYAIVTLFMILRGIMLALFHNHTVRYLPNGVRYRKDRWLLRWLVPFMPASIYFSENSRQTITFKASLLIGSDVWLNHWLYMYLSVLEALTNIRLTYITLQVGTWMLILKSTMESFLFLATAITKITWIMCAVQTLVRVVLKLFTRILRSTRVITAPVHDRLDWNIDGASMFLTFKLFNILLCFILFLLLQLRGSTTFMVRDSPYKIGYYGGIPDIALFWRSELMCDLVCLLGLLTLGGQLIGVCLLHTKFKHVADNGVMRLLQRRYGLTGWDSWTAASMLGLDPVDPELIIDGQARTKLSIGSLLQLLYLSGPSAFVHLAGDYIFHDGGLTRDPVKFGYPVAVAAQMGLFGETQRGSVGKAKAEASEPPPSSLDTVAAMNKVTGVMPSGHLPQKTSIFERHLRVVSDSYLGKTLLVDLALPGRVVTDKETGIREYVVVDALATISILDIKHLLGNEKKLRSD